MKKLIISGGIALFTIPSVIYYTVKYYINHCLSFEESAILGFTLICSLITFGLMFSVYNAYLVSKLTKKVNNLEKQIEEYHYDNIEYHENNRDILLDMEVE